MLDREDFSKEPRIEVYRTDGKPLEDGDPKYLATSQKILIPDDYFSKSLFIKVSDIGSARRFFDCSGNPVTPTSLRAPELVLKLPWDKKIDVWSMGCIIFEFVSRYSLLDIFSLRMTREEGDDEHLQQLVEILGQMPAELQSNWSRSNHYYDASGNQLLKTRITEMQLLQYLERVKLDDLTKEDQDSLGGLLQSMLQYCVEVLWKTRSSMTSNKNFGKHQVVIII
ncbi:hypothetical protein HK098_006226 [Nowakowskiella sp. JEL0407]|nr:hypothetical protein HK098_006226 [Nowakowskiella sp. JEL0407]